MRVIALAICTAGLVLLMGPRVACASWAWSLCLTLDTMPRSTRLQLLTGIGVRWRTQVDELENATLYLGLVHATSPSPESYPLEAAITRSPSRTCRLVIRPPPGMRDEAEVAPWQIKNLCEVEDAADREDLLQARVIMGHCC